MAAKPFFRRRKVCPFSGDNAPAIDYKDTRLLQRKIPERAKNALRSWPVVEKNGFIAVWYDPENGEPNWQLPDIPQWGPGHWGDWVFNKARIKAHGREVIENIVDIGHFPSVHGGYVEQFDNIFKPFSVTQISKVRQHHNAVMLQPAGFDIDLAAIRDERVNANSDAWGDATYHGPSVMYYYTEVKMDDMEYASWWVNYHTPINENEIELTSGVIVASTNDQPLPEEFTQMYPMSAIAAFGQDVEVWKTKVYRSDPILCDGDGPINKLRKWYNRFYEPREQEAWNEPATPISSVRK